MADAVDAFSSYKSLNSILRLLHLSCIYHDGMKLKYSWSITKNIIIHLFLLLLNAASLFFKLNFYDFNKITDFTVVIQMGFLLGYVEYILNLCSVYVYGRSTFIEYFTIYNRIDVYLRMSYLNVIKRRIFYIMTNFIIVCIVSNLLDFIIWIIAIGWILPSTFAIEYLYSFLKTLNVIDIMANIIQIEFRLTMMSDILQDYYIFIAPLIDINGLFTKTLTAQPRNTNAGRLNVLKVTYQENFIMKLSRCYLLILDQTDFINNMYGLRILTTCIHFLIDATVTLNLFIRIVLGNLNITILISSWYTIIATMSRFAASASVLVGIVYRAEEVNKMSKKIIRFVDLILINKDISPMVRDTLMELRELVISRPTEFHAVNFFIVNYRLLLSITSIVVTYTILLLQYIK